MFILNYIRKGNNMYFSECGYTVLQLFGFRLQIVDRKRNKILNSSEFPVYQQKEFRVGKFGISFSKI